MWLLRLGHEKHCPVLLGHAHRAPSFLISISADLWSPCCGAQTNPHKQTMWRGPETAKNRESPSQPPALTTVCNCMMPQARISQPRHCPTLDGCFKPGVLIWGGDFCPQGTIGNVWRHYFWLPQLAGGGLFLASGGWRQGMLLNVLQTWADHSQQSLTWPKMATVPSLRTTILRP